MLPHRDSDAVPLCRPKRPAGVPVLLLRGGRGRGDGDAVRARLLQRLLAPALRDADRGRPRPQAALHGHQMRHRVRRGQGALPWPSLPVLRSAYPQPTDLPRKHRGMQDELFRLLWRSIKREATRCEDASQCLSHQVPRIYGTCDGVPTAAEQGIMLNLSPERQESV